MADLNGREENENIGIQRKIGKNLTKILIERELQTCVENDLVKKIHKKIRN